MNKYVLALCFCAVSLHLWSQDPASVQWTQLKTPKFTLIYPNNYDSVAKKIATMLLLSNDAVAYSLKGKPKHISIVLHNQSSLSNGWVGLAPRISEFFHTPTQESMSPLDWYQSLVLHEYRHVVQFDKIRRGTWGRICYILYGDIGWAFKSGTTPNWFMEGDAVATETALSKAGRGRSPDFSRGLRAQLIEKKRYSYAKATCRSYKDYVPNHYELGYHLVAFGRQQWSAMLWEAAHRNSANRLGFMPFSRGMELYSGHDKYKFYKQALDSLKTRWINEINNKKLSYFDTVKTPSERTYTNYKYPSFLSDNSIIAVKSGMGNIPCIVHISPSGDETPIREIASAVSGNPVKTNGKQIVWVEEFPDIRWSYKSFSDVVIYDIEQSKTRRLTTNQHYYAPTISSDGEKIAVVEITQKSLYNIVIIDAANGNRIQKIPVPSNDFVFTPQWSNDNITLLCVLQNEKGKALYSLNTINKTFTKLTNYISSDICEPIAYKSYIVYTSEMNGENNEIYAYDTLSKQHYLLTTSKYGCRYPNIYNGSVVASKYTANGDKLVTFPFDNRTFIPVTFSEPADNALVQALLKDEKPMPTISDTIITNLKTSPYNRALHLLNIHSWGIGINTTNEDLQRSENDISLMSQNKLGTFQIFAGYKYDNLGSSKYYTTLYYRGWYPVVQVDFETGQHGYVSNNKEQQGTNNLDTLNYYKRKICNQIVSFPMNFSRFNYDRTLTFSFINSFEKVGDFYTDVYKKELSQYKNIQHNTFNGYTDYVSLRASFSNIKASALKDIQPKMGQTLTASYTTYVPIIDNIQSSTTLLKAQNPYFFNYADRVSLRGLVYLPSIHKHHGIKLISGYTFVGDKQKFAFETNPNSSGIEFARGYLKYSGDNGKSYIYASFNYALPLINPDIEIPGILYIKRIKANLFADYSHKEYFASSILQNNQQEFTSYGIELVTENHVLNIPYSATNIGFRYSSIAPPKGGTVRGSTWEFLLFLGIL